MLWVTDATDCIMYSKPTDFHCPPCMACSASVAFVMIKLTRIPLCWVEKTGSLTCSRKANIVGL